MNTIYRRAMGMAAAGMLAGAGTVWAAPTITATGVYTQNFNSLATSGTLNTWSDDSTLSGWFLKAPSGEWNDNAGNTYIGSNGTTTTTADDFYSFGVTGSSDRALGSIPRAGVNTGKNLYTGLALQYSGANIANLRFYAAYTAEVWRDNAAGKTLTFAYKIIAAAPVAADWTGGTWNTINTYSPTTNGSDQANAGDGSQSFQIGFTTGAALNNGSYLLLRWNNPDTSGADNGFAIDDILVTVPESGTWVAGLLLGTLVVAGYRARLRAS